MLNNVKSNFSFNEMNKKDLPALYFTVFRCLLVILTVFLALLHNHCYSLHKTNLRWLNTVLRAVSGNVRDGACFKTRHTNMAAKKQWYTEDDFSKSTH